VLNGSDNIITKGLKISSRHGARARGDRIMLELGNNARFVGEKGNVAVTSSANDGGRPEDESHGTLPGWPRRLCRRVTSVEVGLEP
jgi:hypothetical protein